MTSKQDPLNTVRKLESFTEFQKSKKVATAMHNLSVEEERLDTLQEYLTEYLKSGTEVTGTVSAELMRGRHDFMNTLSKVVEDQQQRVELLRAAVEKEVAAWRKAKARLGAVDQFLDRKAEEQKRQQDRREQARLDETARHLYS